MKPLYLALLFLLMVAQGLTASSRPGAGRNDNSSQLFLLLQSIDPASTSEQAHAYMGRWLSIVEAIGNGVAARKKKSEQLDFISDYLKSTLLLHYRPQRYFSELFAAGYYDSYTATAAYVLVFDALAIPYEIKESTSHMYLMAYPEADQLLVQPVSASARHLQYSNEFKRHFIAHVAKDNYMSQGLTAQEAVDKHFSTLYYNQHQSISFEALISWLYIQSGIGFMDKGHYQQAFEAFEKAHAFYPDQKTVYYQAMAGLPMLQNNSTSDAQLANRLVQLLSLPNKVLPNATVANAYNKVLHHYLYTDPNPQQLNSVHKRIVAALTDKELTRAMQLTFYYERAYKAYTDGAYDSALQLAGQAYAVAPDDADVLALIAMLVARTTFDSPNRYQSVQVLRNYMEQFPELAADGEFRSAYMNILLIGVLDALTVRNLEKVEAYLQLFESWLSAYPASSIEHTLIGKAYFKVGRYYKAAGNTELAVAVWQRGLAIVPEFYQLQEALQ